MTSRATRSRHLARGASQLAGAFVRWGARAAVAAALAIGLLLALRAPVQARVNDALMDLGAQLMRYEDATVQDATRTLLVNGAALHLSSGATDDSVDTVLDTYEGRCARSASAAEATDPKPTAPPDEQAPIPFGEPLRAGGESHGFVACLSGGSPLSAGGLAQRAEAFASSGNAVELGAIHYVYAERRSGMTHFIAFWTTDELNVEEMFPSSGDAPGVDAPGIARPPDSRRRLSLREVGYPYGITIYGASPRSIDELEGYYRGRLEADGWRLVRRSPRAEGRAGQAHLAAMRDGALALIVFGDEPSGASTTILTTSAQGSK